MSPNEVIKFWFEELEPRQWFAKDPSLDELIKNRFFELHSQAKNGLLSEWRQTAEGRLAEIIVLDQFSRNMFRDQADSFATDKLALSLAEEAVSLGEDQNLSTVQKSFLYMPYMHSEALQAHKKAVELFSIPGLEHNLDFEIKHKNIIERFGRYPHRNKILGRISTPEEIEFLKEPNSSF